MDYLDDDVGSYLELLLWVVRIVSAFRPRWRKPAEVEPKTTPKSKSPKPCKPKRRPKKAKAKRSKRKKRK